MIPVCSVHPVTSPTTPLHAHSPPKAAASVPPNCAWFFPALPVVGLPARPCRVSPTNSLHAHSGTIADSHRCLSLTASSADTLYLLTSHVNAICLNVKMVGTDTTVTTACGRRTSGVCHPGHLYVRQSARHRVTAVTKRHIIFKPRP